MGGQACVFYGAAEFSRDTDLIVLAEGGNLDLLRNALRELDAQRIAVPDFQAEFLQRGHAVHFRCGRRDLDRLRIDIMSNLRGVDPFPELWSRRTTISDDEGDEYELLALPDLVQAKKTQRARDWPMIQRLVEVDYLTRRLNALPEQIGFWLRELRTPELLVELCRRAAPTAQEVVLQRPLLQFALASDLETVGAKLLAEELEERERDRAYWKSLKKELEEMRLALVRKK